MTYLEFTFNWAFCTLCSNPNRVACGLLSQATWLGIKDEYQGHRWKGTQVNGKLCLDGIV